MFETIEKFLSNSGDIYLFIAAAGSTVLVIQFILTMSGIGGDTDGADGFEVEAHDGGDIAGLNFFSLKSIVAFITFFGWGGVFWGDMGWSGFAIAAGCGALMMVLVSLVIAFLLRMQRSGNIRNSDIVGKTGKVYLSIPSGRAAVGKVTVALPECTREIDARADEEIATGASVKVVGDLGDGSFLVVSQE